MGTVTLDKITSSSNGFLRRDVVIGVAATLMMASGTAAFASGKTGDTRFLRNAIRGDIAEIQMGTLAQQKSQDADVKALGQVLVADHGQARTKAEAIAETM